MGTKWTASGDVHEPIEHGTLVDYAPIEGFPEV